ncbi:hypothetical protein [Polycladidibacter hongkongensis]|uniref:hypothetical protein n=1 Tax=Polycladidibacter hongkongensis TaxID=1647556 RepID=UPI00082A15A8|nr:hypothetical protein [Pseudovibrio hongkongensis]
MGPVSGATAQTPTTLDQSLLPPSFYNKQGTLAVPESKAIAFQNNVQERLSQLPTESRSAFLDLVKSPSFANTVSLTEQQQDEVLDRLQASTVLAGELSSYGSGDDIVRVIAEALLKSARTQHKNELDARLTAREVIKNSMHAQAEKTRDSAEQTRAGAIASVVLGVVGGAVSLGMSIGGMKSAAKGLMASKNAMTSGKMESFQAKLSNEFDKIGMTPKFNHSMTSADAFKSKAAYHSSMATTQGAIGSVLGQLGSTGSNAASALTQANAKLDEAMSQELAANAEEVRKESDAAEGIQKAVDDIIRSIVQFLKEAREIQNEKMTAFTRT